MDSALPINVVPRDASDKNVLDLVRDWIDVLAAQRYQIVFDKLGYGLAYGEPGADCIRKAIQNYRSPDYYPGIDNFVVSNWRTARGGNPEPKQTVTWYKPNSTRMKGAVSFDLPLNGQWSDLTADFVFFEGTGENAGYPLGLEEIRSWRQTQREIEAADPS
jgi:hypothetical protein